MVSASRQKAAAKRIRIEDRIMRIGLAAVLAVLVAAGLAAQSSTAPELVQARQEWSAAAATGDKTAFAAFLTDDFTWIDPNGRLWNKDALVGALQPVQFTRGVNVRAYPDGAVIVGTRKPAAGRETTTFMQVWVRKEAGWRIAAHQATRTGGTPREAPVATALSPLPPDMGPAGDLEAIERLVQDIEAGNRRGDPAPFAASVTDAYVAIPSDGTIIGKAERMQVIAAGGPRRGSRPIVEQSSTRVHGDFAVTTRMLKGGQSRRFQTIAYAKIEGKWLRVGAIETLIPEPGRG
jgi:ketosteroid isomerase-like protein